MIISGSKRGCGGQKVVTEVKRAQRSEMPMQCTLILCALSLLSASPFMCQLFLYSQALEKRNVLTIANTFDNRWRIRFFERWFEFKDEKVINSWNKSVKMRIYNCQTWIFKSSEKRKWERKHVSSRCDDRQGNMVERGLELEKKGKTWAVDDFTWESA